MLPNLDRNTPTPIYQQIQDWMRSQILSGNWPEHYQLKAEDDLAVELGVNRGTLRNAIKALIREGLLIRIHGKGTFVAASVFEQPLAESLTTFSEGLIHQNISYVTYVFDQQVLVPDVAIASHLGLDDQESVFYLKRVRTVKDKPLIFLQNYVVYRLCPGIETGDFVNRRLFEVMETDYGLTIAWGRRYFEARVADREVAAALQINEGDPVMYAKQITYSPDDHPLELSDIWITGSSFRLSATVKRGKSLSVVSGITEFMQSELRL